VVVDRTLLYRAAMRRIIALEMAVAVMTARVQAMGEHLAELEGLSAPIDNETTIKGAAFVTKFSETTIRKRKAGRRRSA
jgi:hypothetical protein